MGEAQAKSQSTEPLGEARVGSELKDWRGHREDFGTRQQRVHRRHHYYCGMSKAHWVRWARKDTRISWVLSACQLLGKPSLLTRA